MVRLQPDQLAALDAWIAKHPAPTPSRPEALRRVLQAYLAGKSALDGPIIVGNG